MTSRERLLNTIYRKPTDRVPISLYEFNGYGPDSWHYQEPSYKKAMDYIGEYGDYMSLTNCAIRYPNIASRTEYTAWTEGDSTYTKTVIHTPKGDLQSQTRTMKGIHTTWTTEHFLKDLEDIDKYLSLDHETFTVDDAPVRKVEQWLGDKGVVCSSLSDPICIAAELFEMGDFLSNYLTDPDDIHKLMDFLFEKIMRELTAILNLGMKDTIFRICGPEYATPPYMSPNYFYDLVTKYVAPMTALIKSKGAIPRIHSHGNVREAIKQFVEYTDVMMIDPLEPEPDGNLPLKEAKRLYGERLTLMGNIEVREFEFSTPERIDQLVRQAMEDAKEGGGFILLPSATPCCVPLPEIAERNLIQYVDSGLKYGKY